MAKTLMLAADGGFEQPCPIRDVLDRIGDQWSLLVLDALEGGTKRFNELMRELGDISKQMLSAGGRRLRPPHGLSRGAAQGRIRPDATGPLLPRADEGTRRLGRRTSSPRVRGAGAVQGGALI